MGSSGTTLGQLKSCLLTPSPHLPNSLYSQSRVLLPGAASAQRSQTGGGWRTPACLASGAAESGSAASPGKVERTDWGQVLTPSAPCLSYKLILGLLFLYFLSLTPSHHLPNLSTCSSNTLYYLTSFSNSNTEKAPLKNYLPEVSSLLACSLPSGLGPVSQHPI